MRELVIRADSNSRMGIGHVMRCLALALAWQSCGGSATFVSNCESDLLRQRIEGAGMQFIALERQSPDPYDLQFMSAVIGRLTPDWVILDGYHFDSPYQREVRSMGCRCLVIDDYAHLPEYHAEAILNQNINASSLSYVCDPGTKLLLGTGYALLRPEFLRWSTWQRSIPKTALRVLITLGGGDHHNVTLRAVNALKHIEGTEVEVKIAVGAAYQHACTLAEAVNDLPFDSEVLVDARNMPELMAWSDLAIVAAGSTSWELAFMGVPSLVVVAAENQREIARGLETAGIAINLGWFSEVSEEMLRITLVDLVSNGDRRVVMSNAGRKLVDGKGVDRVVEFLQNGMLKLRRATLEDSDILLEWRNDILTRKFSHNSQEVTREEHEHWLRSSFADHGRIIYIAEIDGEPVGTARSDFDGQYHKLSWTVASGRRGHGIGKRMVAMLIQSLNGAPICAEVKAGNIASSRIASGVGMKLVRAEGEFVYFSMN